jgi:hypothetical protein
MRQTLLFILALLLTLDLTWAQDAPKRKSGLWEITRTSSYTEEQPRRIQLCVDQASDNPLQQLAEGMRGETCTADKVSRDGDKLVVEATCKLRASTAKTHAIITGKFDSGYTVQSQSTYKPPLAGKATGHAVLVAKWTGPCAAGQHPGDEMLSNGATVDSKGIVHTPKVKMDPRDKNQNTGKDKRSISAPQPPPPPPPRPPANPPVPGQ